MMPHTVPALYKSQILDEAVMPIAHSSEPVRFQHFMRATAAVSNAYVLSDRGTWLSFGCSV
jgi:hypothetical protein